MDLNKVINTYIEEENLEGVALCFQYSLNIRQVLEIIRDRGKYKSLEAVLPHMKEECGILYEIYADMCMKGENTTFLQKYISIHKEKPLQIISFFFGTKKYPLKEVVEKYGFVSLQQYSRGVISVNDVDFYESQGCFHDDLAYQVGFYNAKSFLFCIDISSDSYLRGLISGKHFCEAEELLQKIDKKNYLSCILKNELQCASFHEHFFSLFHWLIKQGAVLDVNSLTDYHQRIYYKLLEEQV